MGRTIAYCRVSARDQNPELQLDALHTHGYDQLSAEKESGKRGVERPEFTTALSVLEAGDTLVFWKSDRWGRSGACHARRQLARCLATVRGTRSRGARSPLRASRVAPLYTGAYTRGYEASVPHAP